MKYTTHNINGILFSGLTNATFSEIKDNDTGKTEQVIGEYKGNLLITQHRTTERGLNTSQWFDITTKINKIRFKLLTSTKR